MKRREGAHPILDAPWPDVLVELHARLGAIEAWCNEENPPPRGVQRGNGLAAWRAAQRAVGRLLRGKQR